ncbi:MAG: galactokinase [Desulfobacterales bacterium]|nr:galactokinase [Desulfobacterales bacterium]
MSKFIQKKLEQQPISVSAPCRIDMGGTLDISTLYYPLNYLKPCTVNMAIDLRTHVSLKPHTPGTIKISSKGFPEMEYILDKCPFDQSLGLMFAIATYFRLEGVHIEIHSESPPKSALGGSSSAACALVAACMKLVVPEFEMALNKDQIIQIAFEIESSVAGVLCGLQDQLAAIYGGINAWHWQGALSKNRYIAETLMDSSKFPDFSDHILVAYCGIMHESKNINARWIKQFLSGQNRQEWFEIVNLTQNFGNAIKSMDIPLAIMCMNQETNIRKKMTPEVLNTTGTELTKTAREQHCGARFTGAGGGGCIWALGKKKDISTLKPIWENILSSIPDACILDVHLDSRGMIFEPF